MINTISSDYFMKKCNIESVHLKIRKWDFANFFSNFFVNFFYKFEILGFFHIFQEVPRNRYHNICRPALNHDEFDF